MLEVGKHVNVYTQACDNTSAALLFKRIFKNMLDNHVTRRLKITRDAKIDKIFKHLLQKNTEVVSQINGYLDEQQAQINVCR